VAKGGAEANMRFRTIRPSSRLRFQIQELLALIVGYGMAALFFRALWPPSGLPTALGPPALGLYLWVGLAMSGPMILLRHDPGRVELPEFEAAPGGVPRAAARTWAEWAWLFIGIYWIVLALFVIPSRLRGFRFGDALLYGLVPILVALVLRLFGPRSPARRPTATWTHLAAVGLLAAWPVAWACLILLARRLP
jgi:hypothetical protein